MAGINQRASNAKTFFTDKNISTMLGAFNKKPAYLIDVKPGQSRNEQIANVAKLQAIRESAGDGNKYNEAEVNEKMEALNDYLEKKAEFDSRMRSVPSSDYEKALGYFNEKFDTSVVETYENARTELVDYQIESLKDKSAAKHAHPDAAYAAGDMSSADYTKAVGKIFQKDASAENVNSKPEKTNTSPSPTEPVVGDVTENLGPKPLEPILYSTTENLDPHPLQEQTQMQSVTENLEPLGDVTSDIDKEPEGSAQGGGTQGIDADNIAVVDERTVDPEFLNKVREQFADMDLHSKEAFDTLYEGLNTSYGEQMLELMAVEPDAIAAVKDSLDVLHNMSKEDYERSVGGDFSDTLRGVLSANGINADNAINRVNEFIAGKDPAELLSGEDLGIHYNEMLEAQQKAVKDAVAEGKTPDSSMPGFNWMSGIHTDKYWDEKLSFSETKEHTLGHDNDNDGVFVEGRDIIGPGTTLEALHGEAHTLPDDHKDEIVEQIAKENPELGLRPSKDSDIVGPGTTLEALHGEKAHTLPNDHIDEIVEQIAKENPELGLRPSKNSDTIGPGTTLEALYGEKAHTLPNIPKIVNIDEIVTPEANTQNGKPSKTFDGVTNSVAKGIGAVENVAANAQSEPVADIDVKIVENETGRVVFDSTAPNATVPAKNIDHDNISADLHIDDYGKQIFEGNSTNVTPSENTAKAEAKQAAREAAAAAIAPAESAGAAATVQFEN